LAAGFSFQDGHRRKTGRAIEPAGQDDFFVKSMRLGARMNRNHLGDFFRQLRVAHCRKAAE